MIKSLFILVALLFYTISFSQLPEKYERGKTTSELKEIAIDNHIVAQENIKKMKNGVLLVRLDFKLDKIDYYNKFGNNKAALKLQKKQLKENKHIVLAFRELFKYCPVFFYAVQDSRLMFDNKMNEIVFYNDECIPDTSIKVLTDDYFLGEFGQVTDDTTYTDGSNTAISAFVIQDKKFNQLKEPFPYYVWYNPFGKMKKRYRLPLIKMNRKLEDYLKNGESQFKKRFEEKYGEE